MKDLQVKKFPLFSLSIMIIPGGNGEHVMLRVPFSHHAAMQGRTKRIVLKMQLLQQFFSLQHSLSGVIHKH